MDPNFRKVSADMLDARRLRVGIPKGGKTLGDVQARVFEKAGITILNKRSRIDYYSMRLPNGTLIDVIEAKPNALMADLGRDLDAVLVGRDEFLHTSQSRVHEIADLGISECVLALLLPEKTKIKSLSQFFAAVAKREEKGEEGFIVAKSRSVLEDLYAKNRRSINRASVVERASSIESYFARDPQGVLAAVDLVQTGGSLIANGLKVAGVSQADWGRFRNPENAFIPFIDTDLRTSAWGVLEDSRAIIAARKYGLDTKKAHDLECFSKAIISALQGLGYTSAARHDKVLLENIAPSRNDVSLGEGVEERTFR